MQTISFLTLCEHNRDKDVSPKSLPVYCDYWYITQTYTLI